MVATDGRGCLLQMKEIPPPQPDEWLRLASSAAKPRVTVRREETL
jgi:hypothetical protein